MTTSQELELQALKRAARDGGTVVQGNTHISRQAGLLSGGLGDFLFTSGWLLVTQFGGSPVYWEWEKRVL